MKKPTPKIAEELCNYATGVAGRQGGGGVRNMQLTLHVSFMTAFELRITIL